MLNIEPPIGMNLVGEIRMFIKVDGNVCFFNLANDQNQGFETLRFICVSNYRKNILSVFFFQLITQKLSHPFKSFIYGKFN